MEVQQLSLSDLVWLSGYLDSEGNLKIVRNDSLVENKYVLHNNESLQVINFTIIILLFILLYLV